MNVEFSTMGPLGREEGVKKGTTYLNLFMYVIREMEDAVDDCKKNKLLDNDDAVQAWDEAVAFYTGSLEGQTPEGNKEGKFLFRLAQKRCEQFKTCGVNGDSTDGIAKVNIDIFEQFNRGKRFIKEGKCDKLSNTKDKIVKLMAIPMIQGALRYAHILGVTGGETATGELTNRNEKQVMEGYIFTMAVLPLINKADADDADVLEKYMRADASETNFHQVQRAFERNYVKLGITCADVGGIYSTGAKSYVTGGYPCTDKPTSSGSSKSASTISIVLGVAAAVVAAISIIGIFYMGAREKKGNPVFKESSQKDLA